ncbi:MAG TPA: acetyl-CoA carboxylase biotin carboxylase subunit [Armatimonadetes bacterium]|mgnify:CR=1 FL=1|nr:acetyl-CoA carboxylase biotin carboxylase subunit [Armatimonadota bacterium]
MFNRILICDRGEIAVRIIRACRELGVETVAVYGVADRYSRHVELADHAVCIGASPMRDSYLNIPNVIMAARTTGCEAIHPGYGGLAEKATFAEIVAENDLVFVGPPPAAIEAMGNKHEARARMREAGVPVIPGTGIVSADSPAEALDFARTNGYPVMIKAAAGGGGRGIRIAHNRDQLLAGLKAAENEAQAAFANGDVYVEAYLHEPRHIEIQILADSKGGTIHLGERECSIQTTRHQKVLEESPGATVTDRLRQRMGEAAVKAARAVDYVSAGTVECMVAADGSFYFLEMNTRIQVEHPVTELVTGLDLVGAQLRIAAGEPLGLRQRDVEFRGHAIECRIAAQDASQDFRPCSGTIERCVMPGGPGVRVDSHVYTGYEVPLFYDPLLAKVLAWGPDRETAIVRMERALDEMVLDGVTTTLPLQRRIVRNAFFRRGELSTSFMAKRWGDLSPDNGAAAALPELSDHGGR